MHFQIHCQVHLCLGPVRTLIMYTPTCNMYFANTCFCLLHGSRFNKKYVSPFPFGSSLSGIISFVLTLSLNLSNFQFRTLLVLPALRVFPTILAHISISLPGTVCTFALVLYCQQSCIIVLFLLLQIISA